MNFSDHQSSSALSKLAKAGQAALRFNELLSQQNWAVLGIGLNDFQPLVEVYGETWRDQVLELMAELLLSSRETHGSPNDLLVRLTGETFMVITQAICAIPWADELRRTFKERVVSTIAPIHLCDGMVCLAPTRRLPMSSLAIGTVTDQDGPFSDPHDILSKVTKARNQSERPALLFDFDSLVVTANRLREEIQIAEYAPRLLPLIERFAIVTTGPIHDLRNGLNILSEEARRICEEMPDVMCSEDVAMASRYSRVLLETCSEIRFRGVGTPQKVDMRDLLAENESLWIHKLDPRIAVDVPPEPVEVYADPPQIAQALFNLLKWLVNREGHKRILVTCVRSGECGEIVITGDFDVAMNGDALISRSIVELQAEQQPFLYVFQKLIARYGGSVQSQPGCITLGLPKYEWQDIRSADVLARQIQALRSEVEALRIYLNRISSNKDHLCEGFPLSDVIALGSRTIADLMDEFGRVRQLAREQRQRVATGQKVSWESLEASGHFCQLLAANLLALGGEHFLLHNATDVVSVLESVRRMLRSKIQGIAEFEWNVEADLPPVRATETALAQVVMNLALNSLEELARARPPAARLRFVARRMQGAVQIEISDTGEGIPDEVVEHLFRGIGDAYRHDEEGIGLHVVKSIVHELGGHIEFHSPAGGQGTTASVTLPIWNNSQ